MTANARDVAQYIIDRCGPMPAMKLQKLLYYSHAWSLVWDGVPLFKQPIEAWANGPVVRDVWNANKYQPKVSEVIEGQPANIGRTAARTINDVLEHYGKWTASDLSAMTHAERPWRAARRRAGVDAGEPCSEIIDNESIREYYAERYRP